MNSETPDKSDMVSDPKPAISDTPSQELTRIHVTLDQISKEIPVKMNNDLVKQLPGFIDSKMETISTNLVSNNTLPATIEKNVLTELTPKNKAFLTYLCKGLKTFDAYKAAGYKGQETAAYDLRARLKGYLSELLEAHGIDKTGLLLEWKKLLELPLSETEQFVTVKEKVQILNGAGKLLANKDVKDEHRKYTPFIVNMYQGVKVNGEKKTEILETLNESNSTPQ